MNDNSSSDHSSIELTGFFAKENKKSNEESVFVLEEQSLHLKKNLSAILETIEKLFETAGLLFRQADNELRLSLYLPKALAVLEHEIMMNTEEDASYELLLELWEDKLNKVISLGITHSGWYKDAEKKISSHKNGETLTHQPCKIIYFFFRYLSLLLYNVKGKIKREAKGEMAHKLLQTLENTSICGSPEKKCELAMVFQYCRKHKLKKKYTCLCQSKSPKHFEKLQQEGALKAAQEIARYACQNLIPGGEKVAKTIEAYEDIKEVKEVRTLVETILEVLTTEGQDFFKIAQMLQIQSQEQVAMLAAFPGMQTILEQLPGILKNKITGLDTVLQQDIDELKRKQQRIIKKRTALLAEMRELGELIPKESFTFIREATYSCAGVTNTILEYEHNVTKMVFVFVCKGELRIQHSDGENSTVFVRPFLIARYPVTQKVWHKVMNTEPWLGKDYSGRGGNFPAIYISWEEAKQFCQKLQLKLPDEILWEYAYRAGTQGQYYWGNTMEASYCWCDNWGEERNSVREVGKKQPNAFGLYDMAGNVWEYCEDSVISDSNVNVRRVCRGGSWVSLPEECKAISRSGCWSYSRGYGMGFRPIFAIPKSKPITIKHSSETEGHQTTLQHPVKYPPK